MRATALSLHELSYLCGGPRQAVLTAVLALHQAGQLEIDRDRIYQLTETPADLDPVEQAVLDVVPAAGLQLAGVFAAVANSAAVRQTRGMLASRGLAPK